MAKNIYLIGHGDWSPTKQDFAFITVPKGTSISFYSQMGQPLTVEEAIGVMQGNQAPVRYYQEYHSAPNQVLYPLYSPGTHTQMGATKGAYTMLRASAFGVIKSGDSFIWVDNDTTLKQFFDDNPGNNFHWLACSVRGLKEG